MKVLSQTLRVTLKIKKQQQRHFLAALIFVVFSANCKKISDAALFFYGDSPVSIGAVKAMNGPLMGAGLFLLQVERVPSCPLPPSPNEYIFPEEGVKASVCCLQIEQKFEKRSAVWYFKNIQLYSLVLETDNITKYQGIYINMWRKFYLPHAICVTTFPMSSNTFLGLISWFVELCPSCPYPPAPNVKTPPSCIINNTGCSDVPKNKSTARPEC